MYFFIVFKIYIQFKENWIGEVDSIKKCEWRTFDWKFGEVEELKLPLLKCIVYISLIIPWLMKLKYGLILFVALSLTSCESWLQDIGIKDIQKFEGPCTIVLANGGGVVETNHTIEVSIRTETLTYRDDDDKIWSLEKDEYESYSCP